LIAERTAWLHSVAPIWAISPAACTVVETRANGSGPRRSGALVAYPAGGTAGSFAAAAVVAARGVLVRAGRLRLAGAGLARELGAFALRALVLDAAARLGRCAAGFGFAAAFAFARAGVSLGAAAAAAASAGAAPRAGRSRFALRRAGRVRGRLVSTSRSLPFDPGSLGGMSGFLPIP
jgi:hypothetical protein